MQKYKKFIILSVIILLLGLGIVILSLKREAKTQTQPAATHSPTSNNTNDSSGVVDNKGQNSTPNTNPEKSSNAALTLDAPVAGSKLVSGAVVSGEATVPSVNYRIKDNLRGVIGQGVLSVVNGKYSGVLSVHPYGTTGTFEVYSVNSTTGAEENNIKISVAY